MTPERIKELRGLLAKSSPAPWKMADKVGLGRHLIIGDNDETWIYGNVDAALIVEMRNSLEELLTIAEKPGRDGW